MRLATLRDGSPEGRLVVVSRDLALATEVGHVAPTLAAALADWESVEPELSLIARGLEAGAQPTERFHEREARAPLPAPDGQAFRDPRGVRPPGPVEGPEIAVLAGPLEEGADTAAAVAAVRLVTLALGDTLAPVAVTPNELGGLWRDGKLAGVLMLGLNGGPFARADAGGMPGGFGALLAAAARGGAVPAASLFRSGPLPGLHPARTVGRGDVVRLEMRDATGRSVFGAIEQTVTE